MDKNSCNICLDLIPLVKDDVSSEASRRFVEDHLKGCKKCKERYNKFNSQEIEEVEIDSMRVLGRIRTKLYSLAGLVLILGTILGVNLIDSENVFYNLLIIPLLGGVAYLAFERKAYIGIIPVFIITFIHQIINGYIKGYFINNKVLLYTSLITGFVFIVFFLIGILILRLFVISIYGGGKENE